MGSYALSDLHGDYDLYQKALSDIKFDYTNDKLYVLGDVINRKKGAIKILLHIIENKFSINMILGNHEENFLHMIEAYDYIMVNNDIKQIVKELLQFRIEDFKKIAYDLEKSVFDLNKKEKSFELKKYKNWFNISYKRKLYLEKLTKFLKHINYNKDSYNKVEKVLSSIYGAYHTKPFLEELLETNIENYIKIKEYLKSQNSNLELSINNKKFYLTHLLYEKEIKNYDTAFLFAANNKNDDSIYIFGHIPFFNTIKMMEKYGFHLYKKLLPQALMYTDNKNIYCNLDTSGSKGISVLKLETFENYYITDNKTILKEFNVNKVNNIYSVSDAFEGNYFKCYNFKISLNSPYYILYKNNLLYKIICTDKKTESIYLVNCTDIKHNYIEKIEYYCNINDFILKHFNS